MWLAALPASAQANSLLEMEVCLDHFDLECARDVERRLPARDTVSRDRAALWLAFHEGRYDDAVKALDRLEAGNVRIEELERGVPYRPTAEAANRMVEVREGGVAVRYSPGPDLILVEEAVSCLSGARTVYDDVFGGGPEHDVVLDIFQVRGGPLFWAHAP